MRVIRSDVYVGVGAAALVGAAWLVGNGVRHQAAATHDVAAAIDCSNAYLLQTEGHRETCLIDSELRRLDAD